MDKQNAGSGARRPRPRNDYLVHNERRFVYAWTHKVACSSVKAALLPLFSLDPELHAVTRPNGERHVPIHRVYTDTGHDTPRADFLSGDYEGYFKFAFVRNPFDRLVSCYRDKVDRGKMRGYTLSSARAIGEQFYPRMPFGEFARIVCRIPDRWSDPHFRKQTATVCDREGRVAVDFVGRFENLAEDFNCVRRVIGVPELELPGRNRKGTSSPHYREFYDEELRRLVETRYAADLETFGYTF